VAALGERNRDLAVAFGTRGATGKNGHALLGVGDGSGAEVTVIAEARRDEKRADDEEEQHTCGKQQHKSNQVLAVAGDPEHALPPIAGRGVLWLGSVPRPTVFGVGSSRHLTG